MRIFVTGTDTNIGKTIVSAWLCLHFSASYWKPIQCGSEEGTDRASIANFSHQRTYHERYIFQAARSPHSAALAEGISIRLVDFKLPEDPQLIVEGAGGILVPLNDRETMADLVKHLALPVIVVATGRLGSINHTLLTLEALQHRHIPIIGVIISGELLPDTSSAFQKHSGIAVLGHLPRLTAVSYEMLARIPPPDILSPMEKLRLL